LPTNFDFLIWLIAILLLKISQQMKISKLLILSVFAALACSKSDSPPAIQNAKVNVTTVAAPTAMSSNQDTHAQTANFYLAEVNAISGFTAAFTVPSSGATKSAAITATNGRVAATTNTTVTYVWSDPTYGSIGYQVTDEGLSYHWEYFYKAVGATSWLKYLDADALKDGSKGSLKIFDFSGSNPSFIDSQYDWVKVSDQLTFTYHDNFGGDYFILNINTTTKAGSINVYNVSGTTGVLADNFTWTTDGHGTWTEYGTDGKTVSASGTW
jgi:hypothetical protein